MTERSLYILGFVDGVREFLSLFHWDLRSEIGVVASAQTVNNALYRRLIEEPELREGPLRAILFRLMERFYVVTDESGRVLRHDQCALCGLTLNSTTTLPGKGSQGVKSVMADRT
jgi:hypothetical protein